MKFVYFGHSRMLYDTEEEDKAIEIIRKTFPKYRVLNPNKNKHQENCDNHYSGVPGTEMEYFLNLTKMCEFGVFLVYDKDKWSPGSYTEATYMIDNGKKVLLLNPITWKLKEIKNIENHYTFDEEKIKLLKEGKDPSLINENG
jgi:hypothetical protein